MTWKNKKKIYGNDEYYSISNKLKNDKKTTEQFEVMLNSLTLEEVIALKIELAAAAANNKLYGLPLWYSVSNIVKDALLKYTYSATRTQQEAARFLGISKKSYKNLLKKYKTKGFFEKD
jgi:phosphoribosylaminoimidazole carboxylase (NCAIR synthetase)